MGASYPKPDGQKTNRVQPVFGWTDLPPSRLDAPPDLPDWREWDAKTHVWWTQLWARPQATQWEQSGSTLFTLACLYDDLIKGSDATKLSAEMRAHEDRHGLNPKAMLQLRWRFGGFHSVDDAPAPEPEADPLDEPTAEPGQPVAIDDRRRKLRVVG